MLSDPYIPGSGEGTMIDSCTSTTWREGEGRGVEYAKPWLLFSEGLAQGAFNFKSECQCGVLKTSQVPGSLDKGES